MITVWQYGSNMNNERLNEPERLDGSAIFSGLAIKSGYEIAFTHTNRDGIGVSDIAKSENGYVIGCLFKIPKPKPLDAERGLIF